MIKPVSILDTYEQYDTKNKGVEKFLYWVVGSIPENARIVSKPTAELLNQNKLKTNPVIPEYINALNTSSIGGDTTTVSEATQLEEVLDEDWLKYLMKKSGKLGHDERFKNTVLNTGPGNASSDYTVVGPTTESLESQLPYNLQKTTDFELEDSDTLDTTGEIDHSGFTNNGHDTSTY